MAFYPDFLSKGLETNRFLIISFRFGCCCLKVHLIFYFAFKLVFIVFCYSLVFFQKIKRSKDQPVDLLILSTPVIEFELSRLSG